MSQKTANDLVHTNAEYEKLKAEKLDDTTPRETPQGQGPGRRGYDKALFAQWTIDELRDHAHKLGLQADEGASHAELIELLETRDATLMRASNPET